jgi:magnesium transporter
MINIDSCDGKHTQQHLPPERLRAMLHEEAETRVLWVDVSAPTEADWQTIQDAFDFHPLALEDAQKQNQRSKIDTYEKTDIHAGYLFLSVQACAGELERTGETTQELDIFLGPNYLVTIHDGVSKPIDETRHRLHENPVHLRHEPSFLLYLLLDALVDEYFPAMDALDSQIDAVEMSIYDSEEVPDFKPAILLKKRLLLLRQAVSPLRDVLNQLLRIDDPTLIAPATRVFYQDVYDHTLRLVEQVDLHRDIMGGVMDLMMSQTSNRLNQVMKTLTGISTILMSAALVAGIYGMNFKNMPELDWKMGYFLALGLMVLIVIVLTIYFKKIKWF